MAINFCLFQPSKHKAQNLSLELHRSCILSRSLIRPCCYHYNYGSLLYTGFLKQGVKFLIKRTQTLACVKIKNHTTHGGLNRLIVFISLCTTRGTMFNITVQQRRVNERVGHMLRTNEEPEGFLVKVFLLYSMFIFHSRESELHHRTGCTHSLVSCYF